MISLFPESVFLPEDEGVESIAVIERPSSLPSPTSGRGEYTQLLLITIAPSGIILPNKNHKLNENRGHVTSARPIYLARESG